MGYKVFLSGGAAATMAGSGRRVKDLDFRIVLRFSFLSANGDLFLADLNRRVRVVDPDATLFRINDAKFGRTIVSETFLSVEVSISNTVLPVYGEMEGRSLSAERTGVEKHMPILAMGLDDIVFDKMISVMFRAKLEKEQTDISDLLGLLVQSEKHPAYYVRHLFLRRGAAYAFSSKPADLARGQSLGQSTTEERRELITNPEALMLRELDEALAGLSEYVRRRTNFAEKYAELMNAVRLAIRNPPPTLTLLQVTPEVALGHGVDATRSKGGHWESPDVVPGQSRPAPTSTY